MEKFNKLDSNWKNWKGRCVICHKKIDLNKEKYVNLKDYNGKKFISECFYHLNCWLTRFQVTQEVINKQAESWLKMLGGSLNKEKVMELVQ